MPPLCFLVEDDSIADAAVKFITSAEAGVLQQDGDQTLVHLKFSSSHTGYPTVLERALQLCRQEKALPKWNVLHLSEADALRAIQLCIGERMKQECGEFCAQASDVLAVHQRLNNNAIYGERCSTAATAPAPAPATIASATPATTDPDTAAYQRYLADSHLVDAPAVLRQLRRLQEEGHGGCRQPLVMHGRPASLLERQMAAVLTGDELVAVRPAAPGRDGSAAGHEEGRDSGPEPELGLVQTGRDGSAAGHEEGRDSGPEPELGLVQTGRDGSAAGHEEGRDSGPEPELGLVQTGRDGSAAGHEEGRDSGPEPELDLVQTGRDGSAAGHEEGRDSGPEPELDLVQTGRDGSAAGQQEEKRDSGPEPELDLVQTVWHCVDVEPPAAAAGSPTDDHIRNMFSAMFRLLVNSRDELALAAACQAPGLELTGHDFLAIRRTARARAMPMYQTVVSHVRRVELGGSNYQPPADCPLHACTPPLRALVRLVHRLHDLLEEEVEPSKCCLRLLSAVKGCVMRGTRLRQAAVERVAAELRSTIEAVWTRYRADTDPAVVGGQAVQMVRHLCDRLSCSSAPVTDHLSVLEDTVASPGTPGRSPATLPSVVSLFRTPTEVNEDSNDGPSLSLEERLRKKGFARSETPTTSKRLGASLGWLPVADGPAGGASPVQQEPTPPLVAGPTLVCSRSGTKYEDGAGVRAFRELQAADRARQKENQLMSPKSSKVLKKPKRSLFDATKTANGDMPKTAKKRKTEASEDQENVPVPDSSSKSQQHSNQVKAQPTAQKKPKTKQIKQVNGQKSIRDFFRI